VCVYVLVFEYVPVCVTYDAPSNVSVCNVRCHIKFYSVCAYVLLFEYAPVCVTYDATSNVTVCHVKCVCVCV